MDTIFWIFTLFVLILFSKLTPRIEWFTKEYNYDLNKFFLLVKNIHKYFEHDGHIPHGTIRLTKDLITIVVLNPNTYESMVYDVHYNNQTMEITDVRTVDMSFALEAKNEIHTLIKKSPIL